MFEAIFSLGGPRRSSLSTFGDRLSRELWFLDAWNLRTAAQRRTGLRFFGDPSIEPALSVLTDSLEREADLHPVGRFLMRMHLLGLLETRLRLAEYWRTQPSAMFSKPVQRPIFITGMPRSGSTFLHELLAEDPDNRAARVWEVMFPVPEQSRRRKAPDPRIKRAAACLWWFRRFAPEADAVFPMRAWTPHECVAIHSYSFLSEEFVSTCRIPTYETFLRNTNLRPAYSWQRRFLQHLQWGCPEKRWVLKSPDHAYGLDMLFSVFPDAVVIQTHRNPMDVLKSSCHLTEVLHKLYSHPGDPEKLAAREGNVLAQALNRFVNFRDAHPELSSRFMDITYGEITSDPMAVIRRIYDRFDIPLSNTAAERMQNLASKRSRYEKRGPVAGSSELVETKTDVSSFERYCARFKIGWQQPWAR